jgi:hypothetical protein
MSKNTGWSLSISLLCLLIMLTAGSAYGDSLTKLWVYPIKSSICEDEYVKVSADGNYVLAISERVKLYMFDSQGNLKWNYLAPEKMDFPTTKFTGLAIEKNCSRVYTTTSSAYSGGYLIVLDGNGQLVEERNLNDLPTCCCLSGDGNRLFIGYGDGLIECFQTSPTLTSLWFYPGTSGYNPVYWLSTSDNGAVCAALIGDKKIPVLDAGGKEVYVYSTKERATTLEISGNGEILATGDQNGEVLILPTASQLNKAISPYRTYRFDAAINSLALNYDASLVFVGLDKMIDVSFVLMDEKGSKKITQDMGAAVDRLAISADGRYVAVIDDIGGENLTYYECGAKTVEMNTTKKVEGTLSGLAGTFLGLVVICCVVTSVVVVLKAKKKDQRVDINSRIAGFTFFIMGLLTIAGSLLLALVVKESAQEARDKILVSGILYVILGVGLVIFAYLHALRYRRDRLKEKLLNIIESRGKVNLQLLAKELKVSSKTLEALIYEVVGEKRFKGYIDWRAGEIFMDSAIKMENNRCPTCGAFVEMVGKDLVKCPYCGTETFL